MKKINFILFAVGLFILILGSILLSMGPATNVWSLSVAPVVLVLGFFVIIPFSIMYRSKNHSEK